MSCMKKKFREKYMFLRFNPLPAGLSIFSFDLYEGLCFYFDLYERLSVSISWIEQILLPFEKSFSFLLFLKFLDITLLPILGGIGHFLEGCFTLLLPLFSFFWERIPPLLLFGEQVLPPLLRLGGEALLLLREGGEILFFSASSLLLLLVEGGSLSSRVISSSLTSLFLTLNGELRYLLSMAGGEGTFLHTLFHSLHPTVQHCFSPLTPLLAGGIERGMSKWGVEPLDLLLRGVGLSTTLLLLYSSLHGENRSFYRGMSEKMLRIRAQQDVHCDIFMLAKVKGELYRERLRLGKRSSPSPVTEMQDFLYNIAQREILRERGELGGEVLTSDSPLKERSTGEVPATTADSPLKERSTGEVLATTSQQGNSGVDTPTRIATHKGVTPLNILEEVWEFERSRILKRGSINPPSAEEVQAAIYKTIERSLSNLGEPTRQIFGGDGQPPLRFKEGFSADVMALWIEEQMITSRTSDEYEEALLKQFRGVFDYQTNLFKWNDEERERLSHLQNTLEQKAREAERKLTEKERNLYETSLRERIEQGESVLKQHQYLNKQRKRVEEEGEEIRKEGERWRQKVLKRMTKEAENNERLRRAYFEHVYRIMYQDIEVEKWKARNGVAAAAATLEKAEILNERARALQLASTERINRWISNADIKLQNWRMREQKLVRQHYRRATTVEVEKQIGILKALFEEEKKRMEVARDELVQLYIQRLMEIKGERDEALSRLRWIKDRGEVLFQLHSILPSLSMVEGESDLSKPSPSAVEKESDLSKPSPSTVEGESDLFKPSPSAVEGESDLSKRGETPLVSPDEEGTDREGVPEPLEGLLKGRSSSQPIGEGLPHSVLKEGGLQPKEGLAPLPLPSHSLRVTPVLPSHYPLTHPVLLTPSNLFTGTEVHSKREKEEEVSRKEVSTREVEVPTSLEVPPGGDKGERAHRAPQLERGEIEPPSSLNSERSFSQGEPIRFGEGEVSPTTYRFKAVYNPLLTSLPSHLVPVPLVPDPLGTTSREALEREEEWITRGTREVMEVTPNPSMRMVHPSWGNPLGGTPILKPPFKVRKRFTPQWFNPVEPRGSRVMRARRGELFGSNLERGNPFLWMEKEKGVGEENPFTHIFPPAERDHIFTTPPFKEEEESGGGPLGGRGASFKTNLFGRYATHLREELLTLLQITREEASSLTPTELLDYAYVRFQFLNVEAPLEPPETLERREKAASLLYHVVERGGIGGKTEGFGFPLTDLSIPFQKGTRFQVRAGEREETPPLQTGELLQVDTVTPHSALPLVPVPLVPDPLGTTSREVLEREEEWVTRGRGEEPTSDSLPLHLSLEGKEEESTEQASVKPTPLTPKGVTPPPPTPWKEVDPLYGSGFDTDGIGVSNSLSPESIPLTGNCRGKWNLLSREKMKFILKKKKIFPPYRDSGGTPSFEGREEPLFKSPLGVPPRTSEQLPRTGGTPLPFSAPIPVPVPKGTGTGIGTGTVHTLTPSLGMVHPLKVHSMEVPSKEGGGLITLKWDSNFEKEPLSQRGGSPYPLGVTSFEVRGELPPLSFPSFWGQEREEVCFAGPQRVRDGAPRREEGDPMGEAPRPGTPVPVRRGTLPHSSNPLGGTRGNSSKVPTANPSDPVTHVSGFDCLNTPLRGREREIPKVGAVVFPPRKTRFSDSEWKESVEKVSRGLRVLQHGLIRIMTKPNREEILPYEEAIECLKEVRKGALKKDKHHWEWYYPLLDDPHMFAEGRDEKPLCMYESEAKVEFEMKHGIEYVGLTLPPLPEPEKDPPGLPPSLPPPINPREETPPEIWETGPDLTPLGVPQEGADFIYYGVPHIEFIDSHSLGGNTSGGSLVDDLESKI